MKLIFFACDSMEEARECYSTPGSMPQRERTSVMEQQFSTEEIWKPVPGISVGHARYVREGGGWECAS